MVFRSQPVTQQKALMRDEKYAGYVKTNLRAQHFYGTVWAIPLLQFLLFIGLQHKAAQRTQSLYRRIYGRREVDKEIYSQRSRKAKLGFLVAKLLPFRNEDSR